MKVRILVAMLVVASFSTKAAAQHAGDVEFGYDNLVTPSAFVIDANSFTSDGLLYFESEMEELDPFNPGDYSSDEPGFTTNEGEGLLVNNGDQIWLNALDASAFSSFGVGYVNYYNPTTDALEALGRIGVLDNSGSTADLVLNGNSIETGANPQFIGQGDSDGDVHDHVIFDLLDDGTAPLGAYGILFQLQSDLAPSDGSFDVSSDPFWIVWNHGLSESDFENLALPGFGVTAVPEPGSLTIAGLCAGALLLRRRRRA